MIKINKEMLIPGTYGGSNGKKFTTSLDGKVYMVKENFRNKISDHRRHKKFRRPDGATVTGYNNSVCSEYVASNVINFLSFNGVKAHNVMLGTDEKYKIYNICEDFRYVGSIPRYNFNSIYQILKSSTIKIDSKSVEGVCEFIKSQNYVEEKVLMKYFWSMFILDALNLNRDRHVDNWGLLHDPLANKWFLGKVYDNGSCLFAKGDAKEVSIYLDGSINYYNDETIKVRHSLKEKRKDHNRINYREFLSTTNNKDCLKVLKEFYEFLNIDWLLMFIDTLELDYHMKEHYKNIYKHSYELIIKYAYENNPNIQK